MRKKNARFYDTFLMSKGHGCMAQYVILENLKILKKNIWMNITIQKDGLLGCHPDYGNPGIEASTGSLGHGMGLAVGMAHADNIIRNNKKIFLLISDGELQEGSTWENMMMAANLNLKNLICFVDHNGSQSFGITKFTHPKFYPLKEKIKSFGWECKSVNGHSVESIINAVKKRKTSKPLMIICNTVKGKGFHLWKINLFGTIDLLIKKEYEVAVKEIINK